jgi:preprotein translocase subunit SecG
MDEALVIATFVICAAGIVVLVLLPNRGHEPHE